MIYNMIKTPNGISTLQNGQGKELSRIWFAEYNNQEGITKAFNPEAYKRWLNRKDKRRTPHYVLPIVNYYFQLWNTEGFFEKSAPLREKSHLFSEDTRNRLRYLRANYSLFILSLEPIYKFCKENGIKDFSEEEKFYLKQMLLPDYVRKGILDEFPDEDIINATLKYYTKTFILRYLSLQRDIIENKSRYQKEFDYIANIPKELTETHKKLKKGIVKRFGGKSEEVDYEEIFSVIERVAHNRNNKKNMADNLFSKYISNISYNKNVVSSVDEKVLMALGILPAQKNTPPKSVKKVLRPNRTQHRLDYSKGCDLYIPLYKLLLKEQGVKAI